MSRFSEEVSLAATDEKLQAVLPDGGVVFSRVGPNGERDLYYFRLGFGMVEIGGDLGLTIAAQTNLDLHVWDPSLSVTRLTTTVQDHAVLRLITADNR